MRFLFLICIFIIGVTHSAFSDESSTAKYFKTIQQNPNALQVFLKAMPKGGELHTHASGATYAENLLHYGESDVGCVNLDDLSIYYELPCRRGTQIKNVIKNVRLYDHVLEAWSMLDFPLQTESGHDHFFETFYKFTALADRHDPEILAEIVRRAANQNENYLEIMFSPLVGSLIQFGEKTSFQSDFSKFRQQLLQTPEYQSIIQSIQKTVLSDQKKMRSKLGCDKNSNANGCRLQVRYLYLVLREQSPSAVFAQLLAAFELSKREPSVVGINLAQAEDWPIAMRDYTLQMQMIGFLHSKYPTVNISLHAGELKSGLVPPAGLRFHIRQAIQLAGAHRIGHGVDIAYEDDANQLLNQMANQHILVETNLTSNKDVLGLKGKKHPILLYLANHVPIALSTDDEGVLRTDLTQEYKRAVLTYQFDYATLKNFARNSIIYSFLPGQSIWQGENHAVVSACQNDLNQATLSSTCQQFLKQNTKAQVQWELEQRFKQFEAG